MSSNKQNAQRVAQEVMAMNAKGYVMLPVSRVFADKKFDSHWDDVLNNELMRGVVVDGTGKPIAGASFHPRGDERFEGVERIGTKGKGYIEWGDGNMLPNRVAVLASMLPYTAVGLRFNVETATGLGPQPMYHYTYVSNGTVKEEDIPYGNMGELLLQRIAEAEAKTTAVVMGVDSAYAAEALQKAKDDYETWKRTNEWLNKFMENTNIDDVLLHLMNDMVYYNICFPELQLSQGKVGDNAEWEPKVVSLGYHEAHCTRLERMDDYGRINYVYCSNQWMDRTNLEAKDLDVIAIPALDPSHPVSSLRSAVRQNRQRGAKTIRSRQTRYVLPCSFPTPGKPYYPAVPWHSIFNGDLYAYCSTIVSDRYARKRNSNILGRIIYVHTDYLDRLFTQGECTTDEQREAMRDQLWESINTFLSNPSNSGKSLLSFTFTGSDGKPTDAIKVVDIPAATKNDAEAQKTELQEISSVILFALACNPALIGVVPGSSGMGGGTYQRELFLLKQAQLAPTQRIVVRALDTAARFNDCDPHLTWKVRQVTLTTLDRSKTGLIETEQ